MSYVTLDGSSGEVDATFTSDDEHIKELQARNDELEQWVIVRCNELGEQIRKRNDRIDYLEPFERIIMQSGQNIGLRLMNAETKIKELEAIIKEWESGALVRGWREIRNDSHN